MAEGIRDKVAIIGMGCTKFGERFDAGPQDLVVESFFECLADAGIEKKDIQAAWWGCHMPDISVGRGATNLGTILKLPFIPITRVENFCATGSEALRGAVYAVASGAYDICLALGMEKLKDTGYGGLPLAGGVGYKYPLIGANISAPGAFALVATKYFSKYGLDPQEGKLMLAKISSKSHKNGTLSPKAHLRKEASVEQIMNAPIVAWPLGLFDCCGVSDGSAAAIVCRADMAKKFRQDPVFVKSLQVVASSGEEMLFNTWDSAHVESGYRAGLLAYKEAGIKNPHEEISMAEVHDCFSITEAVTMEDLQFSPRGKVKEDVDSGRFNADGVQPIQIDGGLKCFGHPIGATGLRMMYEMYKQLQGKADKRQLKNPKIGLTHNMGGFPWSCLASVCIVGK